MVRIRNFNSALLCAVLFTCLVSCQGSTTLQGANERSAPAAPSIAELSARLNAELERLGINPDKVVAKAPSGNESAVFNLGAEVLDPDGAGPQLPVEVALMWVERLVGDYDQNGEVAINDLTPLGQHYHKTVNYRPAIGPLDYWPEGWADDDGGAGSGNPPAPNSGAENWRLARIDGDGNGELNISDITPMAAHWQERLGGYRIYRKDPGAAGFQPIFNPANPASPVTVVRPGADPTRPVAYGFADTPPSTGIYEYFVVPFDELAQLEGIESNIVVVDFSSGGTVSFAPVAQLVASPASGTAPLTVTFDASSSYDADGSIAKYEWDLDEDPTGFEMDSGTTATMQLQYNSNGIHTMTVRVTDNLGHTDTGSAPVAISGAPTAPTAVLVANPSSGTAPLVVDWDASGSSDSDGSITKFEWDSDNDGVFEQDTGTTAHLSQTYSSSGTFTVKVRVTDNDTLSDFDSAAVTVGTSGNSPPVAVLTANPASGPAPLTVTWDASGSSDPDNNIASYRWDRDGDGTHEWSTHIPTLQETYQFTGTQQMSVVVRDATGLDSPAATASANVTSGSAFWHIVTVDSINSSNKVLSLALIAGKPALTYYDEWRNKMIYTYALDNLGTSWNAPVDVASDYVPMDFCAVGGNPAVVAYKEINAYRRNVYYMRANNPQGSSSAWSLVKLLDDHGNPREGSIAVVNGSPAIAWYDFDTSDLNPSGSAGSYIRAQDATGNTWGTKVLLTPMREPDLVVVNGRPAIAGVGDSTGNLYYLRSADANGDQQTSWSAAGYIGVTVHSGDVIGHTLALVGGVPSLAFMDDWLAVPKLMYAKASDADGSSWSSAAQFQALTSVHRTVVGLIEVGFPMVAYTDQTTGSLMHIQAQDSQGSAWYSATKVDDMVPQPYALSFQVISNYPAIAYKSGSGVSYAVYY